MLGTGLIKGLVETARNFFGSYYQKDRFVTVQYPEETRVTPENNRNFPFLVFDGEDKVKGLRCVACKICEKECPPQCIYIVPAKDERGRPRKFPDTFDIDISVCMSCQICVEVCPFDAIKMDQVFELSRSDRFTGLLMRREDLAKSNEYYQSIHPTEAGIVDAQLELERQQQAAKTKASAAPVKSVAAVKVAAVQPARVDPPATSVTPTAGPGPLDSAPAKP
jgi:NADH-quinone oxidoreductase subunit I